jgi:Fuc2NAc and GlcNAc transferase
MIAALLALAFVLSFGLTRQLRRYALARGMLDVPNARSSHVAPTPRGGGMAIAVSFLACLTSMWLLDRLSVREYVAVAGAGSAVAVVGFLDDHFDLPRRWRLITHFAAAIWLLAWLGGALNPPEMPAQASIGSSVGFVAAVLFVVWMVNLYNFMDGIDALASIEAITVCLGGAVLYWLVAPAGSHWLLPAVLSMAVAGFLPFNYPPARIFMGDGGSGFVGFTLAAFALQAGAARGSLLAAWVILLGVFVVDATLTLVRRMLAGGGQFLNAHRTHAYQHAARRLGGHAPVSFAVGAINVGWLLPIAALVALGYLNGLLGLMIAYVPLLALALHFDAGVADA